MLPETCRALAGDVETGRWFLCLCRWEHNPFYPGWSKNPYLPFLLSLATTKLYRLICEFMVFVVCQTKEELLRVLGLQEEEGSSLEFLRRGYKVVPDSAFVCLRTLNPSPFPTSLYIYSTILTTITLMQNATWWEENVDLEESPAWRSWNATVEAKGFKSRGEMVNETMPKRMKEGMQFWIGCLEWEFLHVYSGVSTEGYGDVLHWHWQQQKKQKDLLEWRREWLLEVNLFRLPYSTNSKGH